MILSKSENTLQFLRKKPQKCDFAIVDGAGGQTHWLKGSESSL